MRNIYLRTITFLAEFRQNLLRNSNRANENDKSLLFLSIIYSIHVYSPGRLLVFIITHKAPESSQMLYKYSQPLCIHVISR